MSKTERKTSRVGVDHLLHAALDHVRAALAELRREPAVLQRLEHLRNALRPHGGDHALHLGAVILGAEGGGGIKPERQHMLRIFQRIGRADHAAERVAGEMRLLDAEFLAQCLEVLDEIVERVGRLRLGRGAMAAQVIGDDAVFVLEMGHEPGEGGARGADAVDEEDRLSLALDREGGFHRRGHRHLSGYFSFIMSWPTAQSCFSTSTKTTLKEDGLPPPAPRMKPSTSSLRDGLLLRRRAALEHFDPDDGHSFRSPV